MTRPFCARISIRSHTATFLVDDDGFKVPCSGVDYDGSGAVRGHLLGEVVLDDLGPERRPFRLVRLPDGRRVTLSARHVVEAS